jgi:hypothetical protein
MVVTAVTPGEVPDALPLSIFFQVLVVIDDQSKLASMPSSVGVVCRQVPLSASSGRIAVRCSP